MKAHSCLNVLLVGKGGQGVILAGHVLLRSFLLRGLQAKRSEVHGMAQRGGSVVVHVRIGECVYSPVIPHGAVDFIMGIDNNEGLRWKPLLAKQGKVVTLTAAEEAQLPQTRYRNMALLGKLWTELTQNPFKGVLGAVMGTLSGGEVAGILAEKMPMALVEQNLVVFNQYFKLASQQTLS